MRRLGVALVCGLVLLSGCGSPDDETARSVPTRTLPPEVPRHLVDLPVGTGHVHPGDRVRAEESVLRVNGRAVHLAPLHLDELAVVPGGVFFRNATELWFTDLGRAQATGYSDVRSLVTSPDGRRLAFVDLQHGPKDRHGTPLAIAIGYDATTGRPLVASYAGMGDVRKDDLAGRYAAHPPSITGFQGDALLVHGISGDYRVPLDGGAPTRADGGN
ncbi:hypothetical protein [Nocardioides pocheonensis]|uniref:Uncharacterized protein n=1 Tax=Nocardioides pocheonensis TaxID=661485 RepID=A0A3N0GZD2_9ACTN|nr:hypothetical protein [Nocardioides pocheonensis]RNM17759.1 hypothetical protein EFL26_00365 [Nocardioides pocheonensis]